MYIAYGSNCELETQILLAGDLRYLKADNFEKLKLESESIGKDIGEVERMLPASGGIKSLENKHPIGSKWT